MKNRSVYLPVIGRLVAAAALVVSFSSNAAADVYEKIVISPQDVGVFAVVGEQQFTAIGVTPSGQKVDITDKVDWYLEERPFRLQVLTKNMKPDDIAQIDANGLLTIKEKITWGRVLVTACYPKGCGRGLTSYGGKAVAPATKLLLQ
ncbi:MAG: hypothetical protein SCH71_07360 [Desulfobulbaceae bacterium]|nr:hypothetical protein [Desulfobulbaceae bacterium]